MARTHTDRILFGAAYYDEYMPKDLDRVDEDMRMMKEAGINLIRIAESTWSTEEPQPGVFDFTHIDRALDAAQRAGIDVIVGTPTYAVPTWMVKMHPEVLAVTPAGPGKYGARQIMDIVNPTYRFYAERIIRRLIAHVADHPAVIGYQVDNETKYYDSVSPDIQALFVKYLRERFNDDLDELNARFGLDYWSNRVNAWEDFPDVTGTARRVRPLPPRAGGRIPQVAGRHRARVRQARPVHHPQLRLRVARLLLRRAAGRRPFQGGAGRGHHRRGHLPPDRGRPDRQGDRLRRRHDPLHQGRRELPGA